MSLNGATIMNIKNTFKIALSLGLVSLSLFSCSRKIDDTILQASKASIESVGVESGKSSEGEYIVKRRGLSYLEGDSSFQSKFGATILKTIKPLLINVVKIDDPSNVEKMKTDSSIEYIEPNYIRSMKIQSAEVSTAGSGVSTSSVQKASIMKANSIYRGKSFINVAVVSTGVDLKHPDLRNKLVTGHSAFSEEDSAQDVNGVGTSQAGLIVASNASAGVYGVAPDCKVMPIKAMNQDGLIKDSNLIDGVTWAIDHGASVVTFTAEGDKPSKALDEMIKYAYTKKVPLIVGSGDNKSGAASYPASSKGVIAVSSIGSDNRTSNSNTGEWVSVSAPGANIVSISSTQNSKIPANYALMSGSPIAAAYVAGEMALIKSKYPTLDMLGLRNHLELTSDDLGKPGPDDQTGFGRTNLVRSLSTLPPKKK